VPVSAFTTNFGSCHSTLGITFSFGERATAQRDYRFLFFLAKVYISIYNVLKSRFHSRRLHL
jgi:hypothetical protein